MPTLHQYELFWYVARHGGITAAARNIPYGIQQPAVSKQLGQLERERGTKLFHRQPFRLTKEGQALFEEIGPSVGTLLKLSDRAATTEKAYGIASSEFVLESYISDVVKLMRRNKLNGHFDLHAGPPLELQQWLLSEEINIAISGIGGRVLKGISFESVLQFELALLVPAGKSHAHIASADYFWRQTPIAADLIAPRHNEAAAEAFQQGLNALGIRWPAATFAPFAVVPSHVASSAGEGLCVGLSIDLPDLFKKHRVRALPLPGFPPVKYGVFWRTADGRPDEVLTIIFSLAKRLFAVKNAA